MLPILYAPNTTDSELLNSNGLGFLRKCTRCEVTKELNGAYEIELEVPTNNKRADDIVPQGYVKVKPDGVGDPQIFRIYEVTLTNSLMRVRGEHIRYRLSDNAIIENLSATGTPQEVWNYIQDVLADQDHGFTFSSNITTSGRVTAAEAAPIKLGEFMIGSRGSMLDVFNGEYDFDNFNITFNTRNNIVSGVCLRLGAGIEDINYSISCDNQYTHIMPVGSVPTTDGGNWYINFPTSYTPSMPMEISGSTLAKKRVLLYDFTEMLQQRYPSFKCTPVDPDSREEAQSKLLGLCNEYIRANGTMLAFPRTNVKIQTRAATERLKDRKVGDYVRVYHEKADITLTLKIIKTVFDALGERYISMELGRSRRELSQYFSNKNIGGI